MSLEPLWYASNNNELFKRDYYQRGLWHGGLIAAVAFTLIFFVVKMLGW